MKDSQNRQEWERSRLMAAILVQPHVKKKITPKNLIPLPWDKSPERKIDAARLSPQERQQRFEHLIQAAR